MLYTENEVCKVALVEVKSCIVLKGECALNSFSQSPSSGRVFF